MRGTRFLSVDPSGRSARADEPQTWNRYEYAQNNPLNRIDPDGRMSTGANDHERKLAATMSLSQRFEWRGARRGAEGDAVKRFGAADPKDDGNKRNAFLHADYSCRLTVALGSETAKAVTDAHESGALQNVTAPDGKLQMAVDLTNNSTGRKLATGVTDANSCDQLAADALSSGALVTTETIDPAIVESTAMPAPPPGAEPLKAPAPTSPPAEKK